MTLMVPTGVGIVGINDINAGAVANGIVGIVAFDDINAGAVANGIVGIVAFDDINADAVGNGLNDIVALVEGEAVAGSDMAGAIYGHSTIDQCGHDR